MVKAELGALKNIVLTSEEILLLNSILAAPPEDITLKFPWGSSPLSHKRSLNYLRYVMDLPKAAQQLAILRLLELRPYRRKWWTLNLGREGRYLRTYQGGSTRPTERLPTGMPSIENT